MQKRWHLLQGWHVWEGIGQSPYGGKGRDTSPLWRERREECRTLEAGLRFWRKKRDDVGVPNCFCFLNNLCARMLSCFSCVQLYDTMDCSPPDSSVHGILQAGILEWVAISSSRGSFRPRDWTHVSYIYLHWRAGSLPLWPPGKPFLNNTGRKVIRSEWAGAGAW